MKDPFYKKILCLFFFFFFFFKKVVNFVYLFYNNNELEIYKMLKMYIIINKMTIFLYLIIIIIKY